MVSEGGCNSQSIWNNPQGPWKDNVGARNPKNNWDCLDYGTAEISKNTKKSPGEKFT